MEPRPVTLITGASAGLGVEFARQCVARGDEVILVARRKDRLNALAAELGKAQVIAADLAKPRRSPNCSRKSGHVACGSGR